MIELKELVKIILEDGIQEKFDCVTGITGGNGKGKSTLGIDTCLEVCSQINIPFVLQNHVIYHQKDAVTLLKNGVRGYPILDDEAVNTALKYDWASEKQQKLLKLFEKIRVEGKIYMFCMPYFSNFAPYFRNQRLRFWFYIPVRGFALIFRKSDNQHAPDPWYNKDNDALVAKYYSPRHFDLDKIVGAYETSPNFIGCTTFNDLPSVLAKEYDVYSRFHKLNGDEEEEVMSRQERRAKTATLRIIGALKKLPDSIRPSYDDWAEVTGLPKTTLLHWVESEPESLVQSEAFLDNSKKFSKFFGFLGDKWRDFLKQQKEEVVNRPAFGKKKENEIRKEVDIFADNEKTTTPPGL